MDPFLIITLVALVTAIVMASIAWRRREQVRAELLGSDREIGTLSWDDYSVLIREHFIAKGYVVREHPFGGADFELEKRGQLLLVQCGHWRSRKVGEEQVRDFFQVIAARNAAGGYLITSGRFTPSARDAAKSRRIKLMDGARVRQILVNMQSDDGDLTAPRPQQDDGATEPRRVVLCPRCGRAMLKRYERHGGESRPYYGCVRAPSCKGRRDIA
ncbi:MAG: restriction endonuclease [Gammaproteobacteria bacterium]|nr:restriction endonuclease [Gammaproteobacteria bacterium]